VQSLRLCKEIQSCSNFSLFSLKLDDDNKWFVKSGHEKQFTVFSPDLWKILIYGKCMKFLSPFDMAIWIVMQTSCGLFVQKEIFVFVPACLCERMVHIQEK